MTIRILITLVVVAACHRDSTQQAYEDAARRINPVVLLLRPMKATMERWEPPGSSESFYDEHPAEVRGAITALTRMRAFLHELDGVGFWTDEDATMLRRFDIASSAQALTDRVNRPDGPGPYARWTFWWHSRDVLRLLATELEELRYCAAQEGVEILSLGGTRRPDKRCP